jgi:hypothetical protein
MGIRQKFLCIGFVILFCILFVAQIDKPNSTFRTGGIDQLSPELLRPRFGEPPHFPKDYVIGVLGRCDAPEESYRYARFLVAGLAGRNDTTEEGLNLSSIQFPEQKRLSIRQSIADLGIRSWRVGGGRVEPDGSVSFLIRFLGREKSVTGELYLRKEEQDPEKGFLWHVDDILLESPRQLSEGKFSPAGADMTVYERFF